MDVENDIRKVLIGLLLTIIEVPACVRVFRWKGTFYGIMMLLCLYRIVLCNHFYWNKKMSG